MESDEESTEMPKIRDFHGNSVDPRTGRIVRNDPNSIFFAPSRSEEDRYVRLDSGEINTVPEMLERVRQLGGRPKQVTLLVTPSPSSLAAPVTRPPSRNSFETDAEDLYEISGGNTFRSTCGHCWQVRERKERPRGFTLQEIHDAAKAECDTCNVLQRSVRHFGDIVFGPTYKFDKVRIEQRELSGGIFKTGLLSNMNKVLVHFDDHGGETFELDFQDSGKLSTSVRSTANQSVKIIWVSEDNFLPRISSSKIPRARRQSDSSKTGSRLVRILIWTVASRRNHRFQSEYWKS